MANVFTAVADSQQITTSEVVKELSYCLEEA